MHHRLPAALAAITLVLLGCSEDPEPKFAPPQTTPPSPTSSSSSPEQTPTQTPQALTPEETVRAWVDARNEAMKTGDASAVEALSSPACETCRNSIDPILEVHAQGGYFDTLGWKIVSSRLRSRTETRAVVPAALVYRAGKTVLEAGAEPVAYGVERRIALFKLVADDDAWKVDFLGYYS